MIMNNTQDTQDGNANSAAMELLLAQNTGNAKSMYFYIPPTSGSLQDELHPLRDLLLSLHEHHITAGALVPMVKLGHGPGAAVHTSALVLVVSIEDMIPETLVCVRVMCRQIMCQIAGSKGLSNDRGNWRQFSIHTVGRLADDNVPDKMNLFTKRVRTAFLAGKELMNSVVHYRISNGGVLESAEEDFAEESAALQFREVELPGPERSVRS